MNKKAILISEVLKMILAIGVILLLFIFAAKLLGIFQGKTKIEQATANMDNLERIIKNLKEGESNKYILLSPQGWILTGWPNKGAFVTQSIGRDVESRDSPYEIVPYDSKFPKGCLSNNWDKCMCICEKEDTGNFLEGCNQAGGFVCRDITFEDIIVKPDENGEKQLNGYLEIGSGIELKLEVKENKLIVSKNEN